MSSKLPAFRGIKQDALRLLPHQLHLLTLLHLAVCTFPLACFPIGHKPFQLSVHQTHQFRPVFNSNEIWRKL